MNDNKASNRRRLGAIQAGAVLALGLACALPAAAQGNMRESDGIESQSFLSKVFNYTKRNSYFRLGVLHLDYQGDSTELKVENAQGLAAQAFEPGTSTLDNTGSGLGDKTTPGGTYGLYLPYTGKHLALEVVLAAPLKLDFQVTGKAASESLAPETRNGIPTGVPAIGENIGTLKALPPNFTIIYRPWVDTRIQPYLGAGAMYLYTYDTDVHNEVLNGFGNEPQLYLSKPVACIGQAGVDVKLTERLFMTADVKYVGCAEVKAELNDIVIDSPTLSDTVGPIELGTVSSVNNFEALLYQLSFGLHF